MDDFKGRHVEGQIILWDAHAGVAEADGAWLRPQRGEVELGGTSPVQGLRDVGGIQPAAGHDSDPAPRGLNRRANRSEPFERRVPLTTRQNVVRP